MDHVVHQEHVEILNKIGHCTGSLENKKAIGFPDLRKYKQKEQNGRAGMGERIPR